MRPLTYVRFRHRSVIEMTPLADLLTGTERTMKLHELQQKTDRIVMAQELERTQARAETEDALATTTHPLGDFGYRTGWYGVERHKPLAIWKVVAHHAGLRLEFSDEYGAVVTVGEVEGSPAPTGSVAVPTLLQDGPLSAELLEPDRSFFRHPEERGFWEQIATDSLDVTARIIYADWLDDHDDSHSWVLREPKPFVLGTLKLDWIGAMARVDCRPLERRRLWNFARITGRGSSVPFTLSDGSPVPQYIAYLLGITRIRADARVSTNERGIISDQTRMLGLSLMADLIVGPDDEPICRVTDSVRTMYFLGEMMGRDDVTLRDLASRLREINHP